MRAKLLVLLAAAASAVAQDSERATHTDTASTPQVSFEERRDGILVRQYQLGCLSHLSYLVVADGEAAVVDPQRDVDHYLRDVEAAGAKLRWVLLTHPHADFVAGHVELATRTGAQVAISKRANAAFAHRGLADGDALPLGRASIVEWDTPGHTPDASTFLLGLPGRSEPTWAFTGDTLFVGSIGRPDLLDSPPAELASQSFDSIQRLKGLPDEVLVLPAHGAGSLCGAHLSPETTSTIGAEKRTNPFLSFRSRTTFVSNVISHQPVAPQYFAMNVAMNRKGPPLVARDQDLPQALDAVAVRDALARGGFVVDVRDQQAYANAHVAGSINIALRGRLDTWMGIVVPVDAPLVLLADDEAGVREGAFRLRRIGYDSLAGWVKGGVEAWRAAGGEVRRSKLVAPRELFAAMQAGTEPMIVDVRSTDEYGDVRLGDVGNLPVTESERFVRVLDKSQPVVMVCNSAYRSSMAVGLAERMGFVDVGSLDGGLDAWIEAGLPVIGRQVGEPSAANAAHAENVPARSGTSPASGASGLALPEPVDADLLLRVLASQPEAYVLFDLRPAAQFAEWHLPGSQNVAFADLESRAAALPANARLVLVDRDGTVAFAAGGALLARDPSRAVRALVGGLLSWWDRDGAAGPSGPASAAGTSSSTPPVSAPAPTKPKKRNAGC